MISGLFNTAAPLVFAGLGALLTELTGVLGIFIEGFMILGAFFSYAFAGWTGSVAAGTAITAVLAGCLGYAMSVFVEKSRANPFIAALALNLAAGGLCDSLSQVFFRMRGVIRNPDLHIPGPVELPLLRDIPVLGTLLSGHLPFVYAAVFSVAACFTVINKTKAGLRLRASGLSGEAALGRGLRPMKYRAWAWAFAAVLAVLGGAALTFRVGVYTPGAVAGRGWIALAAVYLGFKSVWGTALAALAFAFAERIGITLQGLNAVPATLILGIPSMMAFLLFSVSQMIGRKIKSGVSSSSPPPPERRPPGQE